MVEGANIGAGAQIVAGAMLETGTAIVACRGLVAAEKIASIGTQPTRAGVGRTTKAGNVYKTAAGGPCAWMP